MSDKSRDDFESWLTTIFCISKETLECLRDGDEYRSSLMQHSKYTQMWEAWQASRSAVVTLPSHKDYPLSAGTAAVVIADCKKAIEAQGLTVN